MHEALSCGIDVEELSRFDKYIRNNDYSLMEAICTDRELTNIDGDKRVRFALRFSCKEAFFKALGASWTSGLVSWKDIELLFSGPGCDSYHVDLHDHAKSILRKNKARIGEISFEFNDEFVLFQVVLWRQDEG